MGKYGNIGPYSGIFYIVQILNKLLCKIHIPSPQLDATAKCIRKSPEKQIIYIYDPFTETMIHT